MSRGAGPQGLRDEPRRSEKDPLSGEVARRNAETERLQQICDDLSVTFGDSSPERGAKGCGAPRCLPL